MGIDTRFWGPSGWELFHLIAFKSPDAKKVLSDMPNILPCPFCRESTTKFVAKHPIHKPYGKWLYHIHNMVNDKLRTQCADDPNVINPGEDPAYEEVKKRYDAMTKPTAVPGRDFLMSVAYNYPDEPTETDKKTHQDFLRHLVAAYPFEELREIAQAYPEPTLDTKKGFTRWMYGLLQSLSKEVGVPIRSYRGYMNHLAYYKSGCSKKSYKGKTCRRTAGGGYTKDRNPNLTRRIVSKGLLRERKPSA